MSTLKRNNGSAPPARLPQNPRASSWRGWWLALLMLQSCVPAVSSAPGPEGTYPRASNDATLVYRLQSNLDRTHFWIDGQKIGTGRQLPVLINPQAHRIVAWSEDCPTVKQESTVYPPYPRDALQSFTFTAGDCAPPPPSASPNAIPPTGGPSITIDRSTGTQVIFQSPNASTIQTAPNSDASAPRPHPASPPARSNSRGSGTTVAPRQSSAADDLDRQQKALNIIADFADKLCKDIPLKGASSGVELTGSAKAELKGIVSKVAELGFEGAAKYKDSHYEGLLQTDLAVMLKDNRSCRLQVWNDLKDKLLSKVGSALEAPSIVNAATNLREQGDAGGNCKTLVEWPALFTRHSNPEKPPYACQTATRHL